MCPFAFPECSELLCCERHPTKYGIMLSAGSKISGPEINAGYQTTCDGKTTISDVKYLCLIVMLAMFSLLFKKNLSF